MNKVGTYDVIDTRTYIVPAEESVCFSVDAMGWEVNINVVFEPTAAVHGLRVEPRQDHARIVFSKWESSLGTATLLPVELGIHSNGRKLYFMATHYSIGVEPKNATIKFDIQFLMGAEA